MKDHEVPLITDLKALLDRHGGAALLLNLALLMQDRGDTGVAAMMRRYADYLDREPAHG